MKRTRMTTVDLYGALGTGTTKADAKADAIAQIQRAFGDSDSRSDGYRPLMQRWELGHITLVYRELGGWYYQIMWPTDTTTPGSHGPYDTRREAEFHLRRHLAQQYILEVEDDGQSILHKDDARGQREHAYYVRWQYTARMFLAEGFESDQVHAMACRAA